MAQNKKEQVFEELVKNRDRYMSGQHLAGTFNVSRTVIWNYIKELQAEGVSILTSTRKGYKIENIGSRLSSALIKEKTSDFWGNIVVAECVESTNDTARELIKNADTNIVVIANEQLAGRGRRGREFLSPKGGLYMSVAFRPNIDISFLQLITACTAVSVCEAVDAVVGTYTQIKWVNDIYLNNKKLCGILTESLISVENKDLNFLIVGIGINIEKMPETVPDEIREKTIALKDVDTEIDRNILAAEILHKLEHHFKLISNKKFIGDYRSRSCVIGKNITVIKENSQMKAKALDIDDNGALIVQYPDGLKEVLNSGEVSLLISG
ncbi:bifunctional ligase/repressor BirA [Clostridia bacterium]|nr:bifunctional ligase/repressor BirA [Clostridia bacterium]